MPPKKKKGAKKAGRRYSRKTVLVNGIPLSEMTKDQLEEHVLRLREELELEREERNYFQMERDRVGTFYDIIKNELANRKTDLAKKEIQIGEMEEKHQAEITLSKQKVKHLLYEQQQRLAQVAVEHQVAFTKGETNEREQALANFKEAKDLRVQLKEQELANMANIRELKIQHEKRVEESVGKMEERVEDISDQYEKKLSAIRHEIRLQGKMELQDLEERKNQQLQELIATHTQTALELKLYYNEITKDNLSLIGSMKEELSRLKVKEDRLEKQVEKLSTENKEMKGPFQEARDQLAFIQKKMANYERDKSLLTSTRIEAKSWKKELKHLRMQNEILTLELAKMESERSALREHFSMAVQEVHQRCGLKLISAGVDSNFRGSVERETANNVTAENNERDSK